MDAIPSKRCTNCGEIKPVSDFNKKKCNKDGRQCYCRQCASDSFKQWHCKHPERYKLYRLNNMDKERERVARWKQANAEHVSEAKRAYRKSHAVEISKYNRHWKDANPDKARRWNVIKANVNSQRRRARQRSLPDNFTSNDWQYCLDYFDNRCAVCGRPRGLWHILAMDHWIPISSPKCPGTIPTNIIPLCDGVGGCNESKSNLDPMIWLSNKFGPKQAQSISSKVAAYFKHLDLRIQSR